MDHKIAKAVSVLGIPGLFAYVFYLLMDRFHFTFENIGGTWAAIIALTFIISAAVLTWFALHKYSSRQSNETPTDPSGTSLSPESPSLSIRYPEFGDISIPAFDGILRRRNGELYKSIQGIRDILLPQLVSIPITPYSHDSVHHAKEILSLIVELYPEALKTALTPTEIFVLGVFCQVHDVGMKPHGDYSSKQLYGHHPHKSAEFVEQYLNIKNKKEVQALCLTHNKTLQQAKVHYDGMEKPTMRLSAIMSMFRIADMLDVEIQPGPEAIDPAATDTEAMLRIDGKHRGRCIASISIDSKNGRLTIAKEQYVDKSQFVEWLNFFNERFNEYNGELQKLGFGYTVVPRLN
jgi:hypothetical protein